MQMNQAEWLFIAHGYFITFKPWLSIRAILQGCLATSVHDMMGLLRTKCMCIIRSALKGKNVRLFLVISLLSKRLPSGYSL